MTFNESWLLLMAFAGVGACAGVLAGLLGVGGGIIVVPALAYLLPKMGVADDLVMHLAIGTSLSTIVSTALSSAWAHYRQGHVDAELSRRLGLGIVFGASSAGLASGWVPAWALKLGFLGFMTLVSARMLLSIEPKKQFQMPGARGLFAVGSVIGAVATWLGIGGGTLTVPFLNACQVPMRRAIGTSAALGLPIAVSGALGFIVSGLPAPHLPPYALGYVYLPGFLVISLFSTVFAPLGAKASSKVPVETLKRAFGVVLLIAAIKLAYGFVS